MGGSSGGGGGSGQSVARYAAYVENHHHRLLTNVLQDISMIRHSSPYGNFSSIEIDDGFFGTGYLLSSFPSLYDMFGKFMAGLDIGVLSNQMLEDTVNSSSINSLVSTEAKFLEDHVNTKILPKFQTGMRDINSVLSSSYIVGKAVIADSQIKTIEKYSNELRYKMIPVALEKWKIHLNWNQSVIRMYAEILKLFISAKMDTAEHNQRLAAKNKLWPFTVQEYYRAAVGALQGSVNVHGSGAEPSQVAKSIGGALSGAAVGAEIGGPWGAAVGGVLGLAASFF